MGMRPWSWSEREAEQRAAKGFEDTVWDGAQLWKPVGEDVGYGRTSFPLLSSWFGKRRMSHFCSYPKGKSWKKTCEIHGT